MNRSLPIRLYDTLKTLTFLAITLVVSGVTASAQPSDGNENPPQRIEAPVDTNERLPDIDEFVETTEDPRWDRKVLDSNTIYPENARTAGIAGVVIVRALIDVRGRVRKCHIDHSEHSMLDQAAIDAVKRTPFLPAFKGARPIACWTQIEVRFQLE